MWCGVCSCFPHHVKSDPEASIQKEAAAGSVGKLAPGGEAGVFRGGGRLRAFFFGCTKLIS